MLIYLVQHGDAKREEEDPARPLSDKGISDVKKVAHFISRLNIEVEEVFHSKKLRAKQTAELLAEGLKTTKGLSDTDGLAPLDDPGIWAERLKTKKNPIVLVGHLPHLAKLTSLLLSGEKEKNIVTFKMGGIVYLRRDDTGTWSLQWMVIPDTI
jgi:phosphohistidine phosphatase